MRVPVGEWFPDLPPFENPGAIEALNVIAAANSYRPFPTFVAATNTLTARCQGAVAVMHDGVAYQFAGDATKLYRLSGATWSDVSRTVGGAYATPSDGRWTFTQFGALLIADNGIDAVQGFTLGTSSNFSALAGSPPAGAYVATVRDQVFIARLNANKNRVQWSDYNNAASWTTGGLSGGDYQDIPDGGDIKGFVGGEHGLLFQTDAIRRFTFATAPLVYQVDKISDGIGAALEGSIAAYGDVAFFAARDGFYMLQAGQALTPIGLNKVDRYFWNDLDRAYEYRVVSAIDATQRLYAIMYPGAGNSGGLPNNILLYNWGVKRWSRVLVNLEWMFGGISQSSFTLDGLDAVSASIDALPFSLDSSAWSGIGRFLLAAFWSAHASGYFNGSPMGCAVDTAEFEPVPGQRAFVRECRPLVDGTAALGVGAFTRNRQADAIVEGPVVSMQAIGTVPMRVNARYHRYRILVSGGNWTHISGIDGLKAEAAGER